MVQLKASVLKAYGRADGPELEIRAGCAVGEPNAGAVVQVTMVVTAFGPGGDAPGDVDDDVTLLLVSQRPMMFHDSEVEVQDRVGALETAFDDAVDHGLQRECAKMLRDTVVRCFRTTVDVFRRAVLGDPLAHVKLMTVRQPGAEAVRAKPRAFPIVHVPGDEKCWGDLLSRRVTRSGGLVCLHASVKYTELLSLGASSFKRRRLCAASKRPLRRAAPPPIRRRG